MPVANQILFSIVLLLLYVGSVIVSRKLMKRVMEEEEINPNIFIICLVLVPIENIAVSILCYLIFCTKNLNTDKIAKKFFGM
ncbi:hypothetical protein ACLNAL_31870 [Bacillus sp. AF62]|uniref:hypothetical protein n=1 Tax=Bacillus sp. AF62 TaxID=3158960 RepID=UPI00398F420F